MFGLEMWHARLLLLVAVSWLAGAGDEKPGLKCYQCTVDSNDLCTDEYLLPCPKEHAVDRCLTRVSYSQSRGLVITKKCALAPCLLRDPNQSTGLGLDHCDRSKGEYDCVACCKTDGCNKDGAAIVGGGVALTTLAFLCATI